MLNFLIDYYLIGYNCFENLSHEERLKLKHQIDILEDNL